MTDISIFPIPGLVTLPQMVVPLHVFEPRYRQLIQDSVAAHRWVGVSYHDQPTIFVAGPVRILETLPDGRLLVEIDAQERFEVKKITQEIPYLIGQCQTVEDRIESESELSAIRRELDQLLHQLPVPNREKLIRHLNSEHWKTLSHYHYSFAIYQLVIFEPEVIQNVLELRSIYERVSFLVDALHNPTTQ